MKQLAIDNATIVTIDANDTILNGHILIEDDRIKEIIPSQQNPFPLVTDRIDATGCIAIPGLVQAHVHLSQVLFRGLAEEMPLLEWLRRRIFPLEAAHDEESLYTSASLGIAELLLSGTTSCLDMGTVRHTDSIFHAARNHGFRLTSGKAMMDIDDGFSTSLVESTKQVIDSAAQLAKRWHNQDNGLLRYAMAPRFILSCSESLLKETAAQARELKVRLHTHASENPSEVEEVERRLGVPNIVALHQMGITGEDVILAHCVHLSDKELHILRDTKTHIAHCPTTNLKLASGIADLVSLDNSGINIGIGCDGAPCNNRLDPFIEMHLASILQKPKHGARAMPAARTLRMATMGGAKLLGLESEIGSLEKGKRADIVLVDTKHPRTRPLTNPITTLVHGCTGSDVRDVFVNGVQLVKNQSLTKLNENEIALKAQKNIASLLKRANVI